jgi:hypothetical protein
MRLFQRALCAVIIAGSLATAGPALAATSTPTTKRFTVVSTTLPGPTAGSKRTETIYVDLTGNSAMVCQVYATSTPTSGASSLNCAGPFDITNPTQFTALRSQIVVWMRQFYGV